MSSSADTSNRDTHAAAQNRPFQHLRRQALEEFYMGALETIVELERRLPATEVTNEPGTSWEIVDGVLTIKAAS